MISNLSLTARRSGLIALARHSAEQGLPRQTRRFLDQIFPPLYPEEEEGLMRQAWQVRKENTRPSGTILR